MFFYLSNLSIIIQTIIATSITFLATSLGSAVVFAFKKVNKSILDAMLGFSAGVMISASFWSLLNPAIIGAKNIGLNPWLVSSLGFLCGSIFLIIGDVIFDKTLADNKSSLKRSLMLIFSITIHNIPEGLAVGVAFGSILLGIEGATSISAFMLAIGVAIQNFPEGAAISLPLRREGYSRTKSFAYGALSGIVEPISGIIGSLLVIHVQNVLPFFLSFAAGAMIHVVIRELIPESQKNKHKNLITLSTIIGFVIMMILDIALG